MPCNILTPERQGPRRFAQLQGVPTLIIILAVNPVQAHRAGSSSGTRPPSPATSAAGNRALAAREGSTRRLLRLMDRDKNGVASKEEFLRFMSQEFDRLDVNRNKQLERSEMMCRGGRGPLLCDLFRH